jgi:hypothetical protein
MLAAIRTLQRDAGNQAVTDLLKKGPKDPFPTIHAGKGTTEELQAELERLQGELDHYLKSPQASGIGGGAPDYLLVARYELLIKKLEGRIAERGNSALPDVNVELVFDGTHLTVSGAVGQSFPAVSGTPDSRGNFDYSPARQQLENAGPIPQGEYWIAPAQMKSLWYYPAPWVPLAGRPKAAWGSHRITIHPFDSTNTFGRGGFFIHGGETPGSIGCIDLTSEIGDFADLVGPFGGKKIKLIVAYPKVNQKARDDPAPR